MTWGEIGQLMSGTGVLITSLLCRSDRDHPIALPKA